MHPPLCDDVSGETHAGQRLLTPPTEVGRPPLSPSPWPARRGDRRRRRHRPYDSSFSVPSRQRRRLAEGGGRIHLIEGSPERLPCPSQLLPCRTVSMDPFLLADPALLWSLEPPGEFSGTDDHYGRFIFPLLPFPSPTILWSRNGGSCV